MNYGAPQGSMPGPLPKFLVDEDDDDWCINQINYPTISFYQEFFGSFPHKKEKIDIDIIDITFSEI